MKITRIDSSIQKNAAAPFVVEVEADEGLTGIGRSSVPVELADAAGQMVHVFREALIGEDARLVERALDHAQWATASIGFRGFAARCYAAVDLALWDLKAKAANQPVWQLLGGARTEVPAFRALGVGEKFEAATSLQVRGSIGQMAGVLVEGGGPDPEADVHFLQELQANHGESLWIAVNGQSGYDLDAALGVGHFLEEDLGADWFENPLPIHDRLGYKRLADRLDVPLAVGSTIDDPNDFLEWIVSGQVRVIRPDVLGLGGLTATLPVIHVARMHGLSVVPIGLPEVNLQLACGLSAVRMVQTTGGSASRLTAPTVSGWNWHHE